MSTISSYKQTASGLTMALMLLASIAKAETDRDFLEVDNALRENASFAIPRDSEARYRASLDRQQLLEKDTLVLRDENGDRLLLKKTDFETRRPNAFVWRGRVHDLDRRVGTVTLSVKGESIHGHYNGPHGRYRITTAGNGQAWLDRLDLTSTPEQRHPPEGAIKSEAPMPSVHAEMARAPMPADHDDEAAVVDLMAYYTDDAIAEYPDEAALRLALRNTVDSTNTAYMESDIDHRVRLMGLVHLDFNEPENMGTSLQVFAQNATARSIGARYAADLQTKFGVYQDYCGIAYSTSDYLNDYDWGFSVNNAFTGYPCFAIEVVAHELGHNMGLHHDPDNGPDPWNMIEPFAYGHVVVGEFQTVMAYYPGCGGGDYSNCPPAYVFSNPDVNDPVSGLPSGIEGERDNAEVLRRSMPHVQNWAQSPSDLATAAGDEAGLYSTQGGGLWAAQDHVTRNGEPTLVSGPVFGSEQSRLIHEPDSDDGFMLVFQLRAEDGENPEGLLTITADDETILTIDEFDSDWGFHQVPVAAGTDEIHWIWEAPGRPSADTELGVVYLSGIRRESLEESEIAGQVMNLNGVAVDDVKVVALNSAGEKLGSTSSDSQGHFQTTAFHLPDEPPEILRLEGEGVAVSSHEASACMNSSDSCTLTAEGAERRLAGTVSGLLDNESITVHVADPLANNGSRSLNVTSDSEGTAAFDFSVDALLIYGPFDIEGQGYALDLEPGDSISARDGDVEKLEIGVSTAAPEIVDVREESLTAKDYSVQVEVDTKGRDTEVRLSAIHNADGGAASTSEYLEGSLDSVLISLEVSGLDCESDYTIEIAAVNDHDQAASPRADNVTSAECATGGGSSGCSLGENSRLDPLFILLLTTALLGVLRRRTIVQPSN